MDFSKRWSFKLATPEAALPRGSFECFQQAVDCLLPRSPFHREDAANNNLCTCIQCAGAAIQNLAVAYNSRRLLVANAPRAKDVILQVEAVRDRAQQLLKSILSLDDYARAEFQKFGGVGSWDLPVHAGYFDRWDEEDPEETDNEWVQDLSALLDRRPQADDALVHRQWRTGCRDEACNPKTGRMHAQAHAEQFQSRAGDL
jgi:hypothetical protein